MRQLSTRLHGLVLIEPEIHADERGFFVETFRLDTYAALGIDTSFVQDNHSRSERGTLRAFHFQVAPGQSKLIRVARGAVYDVVIDLRRSSPTFGQSEGFVLDDLRHHQLSVPVGFAHGFCVIDDVADVVYKVGSYYDPEAERGIAWDDPDLGVTWPGVVSTISARDQANPRLRDITADLPEW